MEELTQGQAATLVRNERLIDSSAEEMDDLEEVLIESISDSLRGAREKNGGAGAPKKKKRCGSTHTDLPGQSLVSASAGGFC